MDNQAMLDKFHFERSMRAKQTDPLWLANVMRINVESGRPEDALAVFREHTGDVFMQPADVDKFISEILA